MIFEETIIFAEKDAIKEKISLIEAYDKTSKSEDPLENEFILSFKEFLKKDTNTAINFLENSSNLPQNNESIEFIKALYKIRVLKSFYYLYGQDLNQDQLPLVSKLLQGAENAKKFNEFDVSPFWEGLFYLCLSKSQVRDVSKFSMSDTQMFGEIALTSLSQFESKYFTALCHSVLAKIAMLQGDSSDTLNNYQAALVIYDELKLVERSIVTISNLATNYTSIKDFTTAEEYFNLGFELLKKHENHKLQADLLINRLDALEKQELYDEALSTVETIINLVETHEFEQSENFKFIAKRRLAKLYQLLDQIDESDKIINDLLENDPKVQELNHDKILLIKQLIENQIHLGDMEKAKEIGDNYLDIALETDNANIIIPLIDVLTRIYQKLGQSTQIKELIQLSLDFDESSHKYIKLIELGDEFLKEYQLSKANNLYLNAMDVSTEDHNRNFLGIVKSGLKLINVNLLQGKLDLVHHHLDQVQSEISIFNKGLEFQKFRQANAELYKEFLEYAVFYYYLTDQKQEVAKYHNILISEFKEISIASIYYLIINTNDRKIIDDFYRSHAELLRKRVQTDEELIVYNVQSSLSDRPAEKFTSILPLNNYILDNIDEDPFNFHLHFIGNHVLQLILEEFQLSLSTKSSDTKIKTDFMILSRKLEKLLNKLNSLSALCETYVLKLVFARLTDDDYDYQKIQKKLDDLLKIKGKFSFDRAIAMYKTMIN
jgi:hypothetical protein